MSEVIANYGAAPSMIGTATTKIGNQRRNRMKVINIKNALMGLVFLFGTMHIAAGTPLAAGNKHPELPPACAGIEVNQDQKVAFHAYAIGVQIYRWTGSVWEFKAPEANLYASANYHGKIGIHYAGPIWESNSGSIVKGTRINGCDVDPSNSIPWLLLGAAYTDGGGIFSRVTFIQRVNTSGGLKPSVPGIFPGEEKRIPYTAEYYFYRGED